MGILKKKKGILKKKSGIGKFWSRLSAKNKVGLVVFLLVLVGAGAALALSQSDQSLQSHASLECNSNCERACSRLKTAGQTENYNKCIANCEGKCDLVSDDAKHQVCHSPFASRFYSLSAAYKQKGEGKTLGTARMAWLSRVFTKSHIDIRTETQFTNWFELNCQVEDETVPPPPTCQPDWTQVVTKLTRVDLKYVRGTDIGAPQPARPQYSWSNGCQGRPSKDGKCTTVITPLSTTDLAHYEKWLTAGRPAITENLCGGGSTKAVIVPDISWETCISTEKYAIFEGDPATCETTIKDQVKVAVLGDARLPQSQCPPRPGCTDGVLEINTSAGITLEENECLSHKYICNTRKTPLTWRECIGNADSKLMDSYPQMCMTPDGRKVKNPNQSIVAPETKTYCQSDTICKSGNTCYFPPMKPCPEGLSCPQLMPAAYCVLKTSSSIPVPISEPTPPPTAKPTSGAGLCEMCGGIAAIECASGYTCWNPYIGGADTSGACIPSNGRRGQIYIGGDDLRLTITTTSLTKLCQQLY